MLGPTPKVARGALIVRDDAERRAFRLMQGGKTRMPGPKVLTEREREVLTTLLADIGFVNRGAILIFVLVVWVLQLWWSQAWLSRFQFGPAEWFGGLQRIEAQPFRRPRDPLSTA